MKRGFTLVELSIVLVIIGLLIGGILVTQSMIETARVQNVVKTIQQYDVAISNFKTKYAAMPGDSSKFGCVNGGTDQNRCNDGFITSLNVNTSYANSPGIGYDTPDAETGRVWNNLQSSGFTYPKNLAVSSGTDVTDTALMTLGFPVIRASKDAFMMINSCYNTYGRTTCYRFMTIDGGSVAPAMTPAFALAFDLKIDDGKPYAGKAQNWNGVDNPAFLGNTQCDSASVDTGNGQPFESSQYTPGVEGVNCYMEMAIMSDRGQDN